MLQKFFPADHSPLHKPAINSGLAAAIVLLVAIAANAYTLVLHDGRRIEIPDDFIATRTTVTYELSPGFNKTILVRLIDVPATERANSESPGDFFNHREKEPAKQSPLPNSQTERARLTITNDDLKPIAARRIESEKQYERRRVELGLPSVAESTRQRTIAESDFYNWAREKNSSKESEETYWRGRARSLRDEIAANEAQINYVRNRLAEVTPSGANGLVLQGSPYGPWGPVTVPNIHSTGAGVAGNGTTQPQYPNPGVYPCSILNPCGYPYPNTYPGYPYPPNGYPYPPYGYPPYGYPTYGYSNGSSDYSAGEYERRNLTERLDQLMTIRAGLSARWSQLEDQARDARVPQVWLEP